MGHRVQAVHAVNHAAASEHKEMIISATRAIYARHKVKATVESRDDWKKMKSRYINVKFLNVIRDVTYKFESHKNPYMSIHTTQRDTFIIKQGG